MSDPVLETMRKNSARFDMMRKSSFSKLHETMGGANRSLAPLEEGEMTTSSAKNRDTERLYNLMNKHLATDTKTIQRSVVNHVEYTLARNRFNLDNESCYRATAYSVRDRLIEMYHDTSSYFFCRDVKRCYYLSLEFLMGRTLQNALVCLDIEDQYKTALADLGFKLEALYEYEHDAALGNGGLGRLAACFLDSMAATNYPCWGYGIRYTYGIFEQKIINGWQCEYPDYWLVQDNPWEICRHDVTYAVRFGGQVQEYKDSNNRKRFKWTGGTLVQAVAYDNPIPGFDTFNCLNLRLWRSAPSKEFDFDSFNRGAYLEAIRERQDAECISAVLYPNDNSMEGKELRLKQQYFFVCATVQDVLRRFKKRGKRDWKDLPSKMAIQLNDTHPTIAIPELIRILVDVEGLEFQYACSLTKEVFGYTNHTVLPEALEKWPASLIEKLLPRHLLIINEINHTFLTEVRAKWGDDFEKISRMSIYEDGWAKCIRMANLAVIGSHKVNGVAAIHSGLVKSQLFPELAKWYADNGQPNKFINITNGVTPRRWVYNANRPLADLISSWLGSDSWLKQLDLVSGIMNHIDDEDLIKEWAEVKRKNKERLARWVLHHGGPKIEADKMLFDVQVKRIHEYKRQHMNALYMIHRYLTIKRMSHSDRANVVPRATFVGGKAAPGYATAKTIIKMINCIANIVNNDSEVSPYYKIFFLPNYNVSSAEIIIPASDINQQISTAGTEASGTSNMKFVMNGSLIIGTLDGASVEIVEEGGADTAFIFGAREPEVAGIRSRARNGNYPIDGRLWEVFNFIRSGKLAAGDSNAHSQFCDLVERLTNNREGSNGDFYLVCHDFPSYIEAHRQVDECYKQPSIWWKKSIKAAMSMGQFSTDRTIKDYAEKIWGIEPVELAGPSAERLKRLGTQTEMNSGVEDVAPMSDCREEDNSPVPIKSVEVEEETEAENETAN